MANTNSKVDLLIVGAGAAGMMAATCAAAYGMNARVIDKRPQKLASGHGDGIHARMMEILNSFGLADAILQHGHLFTKTHTWARDSDDFLERRDVSSRTWDPTSPFSSVGLTQAKMADILLDYVNAHSNFSIERGSIIESISIDEIAEYPVTVTVRNVATNGISSTASDNDIRIDDDDEVLAKTQQSGLSGETIRAKYVVACDGAHSWIRRTLDIRMIGDDTDVIWGVMDIHPITNFPSARVNNVIQGKGTGLMWIARERGMIRIYTVVGSAKSDEHGKLIRSSVTPESILAAAQKMLHPYTLTYKRCEWWAAYQIGQRVATDNMHESGRIFLAGDAVHTHSPQAGQGLNVSMADTYNLIWKLNLVLKGYARPHILQTYREERLVLGQQLVDFDRQWAALISRTQPPKPPPGIKSIKVTWETMMAHKHAPLIHGLQIIYQPSVITMSSAEDTEKATAITEDGKIPRGIVSGMRFPSYQVRRHADTGIQHLGKALQSEGRFRFIIFAGDVSLSNHLERLSKLAAKIESLMKQYQRQGHPQDELLDTMVVHTTDPLAVNLLDLPDIFHPLDPELGYNYDKIFYDEDIFDRYGAHFGSAYEKYEVSRDEGRLVLLRPDGYVAYQGGLEDFEPVVRYFDGLLVLRNA